VSRFVYSQAQVRAALEALGVRAGDMLLLHTSLGRLGVSDQGQDADAACRTVHAALRDAVGPRGTLLTPSYTYSAGKGELFDPRDTPSTVGPFSEFLRARPDALRSREPMLAVSGEGPAAAELFHALPPTCYGKGCVYDRLCDAGATVMTIGLDLHWATFRHHIEEIAGVPFRRVKHFEARLREPDGREVTETWGYFAAPYIPNCGPDGNRLAQAMRDSGHLRAAGVGIGQLMAIGARTYRDASLPLLAADPWFTAKGPACDLSDIAERMNKPRA
jgi:aminoglycoside 3-N-acetyltransferase